jgi:photosystem II stability/assembly factor-like uncharacterized protein
MAKTQNRPGRGRPRAKGKRGSSSGKRQPLPWYRRYAWLPFVAGLAVVAVVIVVLRAGQSDAPAPTTALSNPVVGEDLHSLVVDPSHPNKLYIGSHQGVSVSTDGGRTWKVEETLDGADAMGWAFTDDAILVGGHPGISVSTDGGATFEQRNDGLPSTDVHALGAGKDVIYAGLAGVGTFASTDGGRSWEMRNEETGAAFMGRILVDPADDEHVVAPDMEGGALESTDGGRTWEALGSIPATMWVSWDESDTDHMIVTGIGSTSESIDGGASWQPFAIPDGASIVEFSPHDPEVLHAAVLRAPDALLYVSNDGGATWTRP